MKTIPHYLSKEDFETCPACKDTGAKGDPFCSHCDNKGVLRKKETYICNQCGGLLWKIEYKNNGYDVGSPHGLVDAQVSGGYFSYHIFDLTSYTFSICEKCLRNLFDNFKIPPHLHDYISKEKLEYKDDTSWYKKRLWIDDGGQKEKLKTGICNYEESCTNKAIWREFISGHITNVIVCEEHKLGATNSEFIALNEAKLLAVLL